MRKSSAEVGKQVLAAFEKGRDKAIRQAQARSSQLTVQIAYLTLLDRLAGHPARGRAGRISRKLNGVASERWIRKKLVQLIRETNSMAYSIGESPLTGGRL